MRISEERVTTAMLFGEAIPEEDIDQGNKSCIYQVSGHVSSDGTSFNLVSLFNRQAEATNEIFKMAGKVYANVLSRWRDNGKDMDDAMMPFLAFHQRPWWEVRDALVVLRLTRCHYDVLLFAGCPSRNG